MLINQTLERFQQRVICNNKCYFFRFTLFSIAIFFLQLDFAHFLLSLMFRIASCLKPWFHIVQMSFKICFIIACPAYPQCLTKNNGTFGMVWMSRYIVQVMMISRQCCYLLTSQIP